MLDTTKVHKICIVSYQEQRVVQKKVLDSMLPLQEHLMNN